MIRFALARVVASRSTILCAFALVIGCGGDSGADPAEVERLRARAGVELGLVTPDSLATSTATLRSALELAPQDPDTIARIEANAGFSLLLYDIAVDVPAPAQPYTQSTPGWSYHVIGGAARQLAQAKNTHELRVVIETLDRELARERGPWLVWLRGRAAVLLGDRTLAYNLFVERNRPLLSDIDRAYLLAGDNKVGDAIQIASAPDLAKHPLAALARATIRAEAGIALGEAVNDLKAVPATVPALQARSEVAHMLIALDGERYDVVAASLKKLGSSRGLPSDCAMWARIAWAYLHLGRPGEAGRSDHRAASVTRERCAFARAHPLLAVVDASLQLGVGRFEAAHATASKVDLPWARVIDAEALLELGDPAKAKQTVVGSDAQTPLGAAIRLVLQAADVQLLRGKPKDLVAELSHLEGMADDARTQRGRHMLGATHLALGDLATAKAELRRAITDTTEASPNPRANRTHTLLAEIAFVEGDLDLAAQEVQQALATHGHDLIAQSLHARLAMRNGDAEGALQALATMRKAGWMPAIGQLVAAEALVARTAVTAAERDEAKKLVAGLVGHRSIPAPELGRVAALVDPKLPRQLKLPVGKLPGKRA